MQAEPLGAHSALVKAEGAVQSLLPSCGPVSAPVAGLGARVQVGVFSEVLCMDMSPSCAGLGCNTQGLCTHLVLLVWSRWTQVCESVYTYVPHAFPGDSPWHAGTPTTHGSIPALPDVGVRGSHALPAPMTISLPQV